MKLHLTIISIFLVCLSLSTSLLGSPTPDRKPAPHPGGAHLHKTWVDKRQLVKDLLGIIDNPLGTAPAPPSVPIPPVAQPSPSLPPLPVVVLPTPVVTQPVATPNPSEVVNAVVKALCDKFLMSVIAACSGTPVSAGCGVLSAVLTSQCAGVVVMPMGLVDVNRVVATVPGI